MEVARFVQDNAQFVAGHQVIRFERDRFLQRRDSLRVLPLSRACDTELKLREGDVWLRRGHALEEWNRLRERSVLNEHDGMMKRIGGLNAVFRIDAPRRVRA